MEKSIQIIGQDFKKLELARNPIAAIMKWFVNHNRLNYNWRYSLALSGLKCTIGNVSTWQVSEFMEDLKECWQKAGYSWDRVVVSCGRTFCRIEVSVKPFPNDNMLEIRYETIKKENER